MTVLTLSLAIILILKLTVGKLTDAQDNGQGVGCLPKCNCGQILGKTGPRFSIITCDEMPNSKLPQTFTNLKVLNSPDVIKSNTFNPLLGNHLKNVDLCNSGIKEISDKAFSSFIQVNIIKLSQNEITTVSGTAFMGLPFLKEIYMDKNKLKHIENSCFVGVPKLQKLYLQHNEIQIIPHLPPTLQTIDLSHNKIQELKNFKIQENIRYFDVCGNKIRDIPRTCFEHAKMLRSLCVPGDVPVSKEIQGLKNITISAPIENTVLSQSIMDHLQQLTTIEDLALVGFEIENIHFLKNKQLNSLKLISTKPANGADINLWLDNIAAMKSLTLLDFTNSPKLAQSFLMLSPNDHLWDNLKHLKTLILKNASLPSLGNLKTDNENTLNLDVSYNPLNCNCSLKNKFTDYNINIEQETETLCSDPPMYRGFLVPEVFPQLLCKEGNDKDENDKIIDSEEEDEEEEEEEEGVTAEPYDPLSEDFHSKENEFDPSIRKDEDKDISITETYKSSTLTDEHLKESYEDSYVSKETEENTEEDSLSSNEKLHLTLNGTSHESENYDTMESEADKKTQHVKYVVVGVVVAVLVVIAVVLTVLGLYLRRRGHARIQDKDSVKEATSRDNLMQYSPKK